MKYIIIALLFLIIIWFLFTYDNFIKLEHKYIKLYSEMDIHLKKRLNLTLNLVEVTKCYLNSDNNILNTITQSNIIISNTSNTFKRLQAESELSAALDFIMNLDNMYQELDNDQNFLYLINILNLININLVEAQKNYNQLINDYNIKCLTFPTNIIAITCKFKVKPHFN